MLNNTNANDSRTKKCRKGRLGGCTRRLHRWRQGRSGNEGLTGRAAAARRLSVLLVAGRVREAHLLSAPVSSSGLRRQRYPQRERQSQPAWWRAGRQSQPAWRGAGDPKEKSTKENTTEIMWPLRVAAGLFPDASVCVFRNLRLPYTWFFCCCRDVSHPRSAEHVFLSALRRRREFLRRCVGRAFFSLLNNEDATHRCYGGHAEQHERQRQPHEEVGRIASWAASAAARCVSSGCAPSRSVVPTAARSRRSGAGAVGTTLLGQTPRGDAGTSRRISRTRCWNTNRGDAGTRIGESIYGRCWQGCFSNGMSCTSRRMFLQCYVVLVDRTFSPRWRGRFARDTEDANRRRRWRG